MKLLLKLTLLIITYCSYASHKYTMVNDTILSIAHSENTVLLEGCSSLWPEGLNKKSYSYATLKDGNEFGTTTNGNILLNIKINDFASLKFTTPDDPEFSRRLNFVYPPAVNKPGQFATVSISHCPGDLSVPPQNAIPSVGCSKKVRTHGGTFIITTKQSYNDVNSVCVLDPNIEYYMNFVIKEDPYSENGPVCFDPNDTVCALFFSEGIMDLQ